MTIRRSFLFAIAGLALLSAVPSRGQAKDPFVGTWLLSRGKSDFNPPLNFFRRTMIFEALDGGYKCTIKTVSDRQQTFESFYSARLDGKDVPIDLSNLDTVAVRRINASTLEQTGKIKGKAVETVTLRVSEDGKVLTVTTMGSIEGEAYSSTQVFLRQ